MMADESKENWIKCRNPIFHFMDMLCTKASCGNLTINVAHLLARWGNVKLDTLGLLYAANLQRTVLSQHLEFSSWRLWDSWQKGAGTSWEQALNWALEIHTFSLILHLSPQQQLPLSEVNEWRCSISAVWITSSKYLHILKTREASLSWYLLWVIVCPPPNSHVEVSTPST